ncbi:MAG TPA: GGDEF and EAL domain-containing protein [Stellaceae bacterium]|nr:GGDEF and EAL domain-containing protein [Stellaceae bacterium]
MAQDVNAAPARVLAALAAAGDAAYEWDLQSDVMTWHGSPRMLGLTDEESIATGKGFAGRINPEDLLLRQQRLQSHYNRGSAFDVEYRIRLGDGGFAWLNERGTVELDRVGRPSRMLGVLRVVTQRKTQEQRLERLANYDDLTGHFNKKRLREALDHMLAHSTRTRLAGAYLAIGIDKLANINDTFGYETGDKVIVEMGQRLDRCLRVSDVIGRVGGDRFGIVLAHCPEHNIATVAEKILGAVSQMPFDTEGGPVYATVSVGAASYPDQAKTSYEVMTRAETALAEAKRAGRDCFVPYRISDEQRQRHRNGVALGERVQRALRDQRLCFAYQPVIDANSGAVDYYECLLRMIDDDGRVVPASEFVAAIEKLGYIRLIDRYVLERAVAETAAHPGVCLGFNISGFTATDRAWLRGAAAILQDQRETASRLVVEITETAALHDLEESAEFVTTLRQFGCRIALDDFGAGFTSLRHLQALSLDTVKIDGAFVRNLAHKADNQVFLRHLVGLARSLNLMTVAECVETAEEAAMLRREGVHFLQGYYYGAPSLEPPWAAAPGQKRAAVGAD